MTDNASDPSGERRGDLRRTALKGARIIAQDGTMIDCRIRNISDGGARLDIGTPRLLPHTFDLESAGMPTRRCSLRWAKGNLVGVQFED